MRYIIQHIGIQYHHGTGNRSYNDNVKYKPLYKKGRSKRMRIIFAFSRPRTNGKVERQFQNLFGKIRRVLHAIRLVDEVKNGVWVECMIAPY